METMQAIRGRRSVRAYTADPVPRQVIAQVLDAAHWAPSGSNRQRWRVTVLAGPGLRALADELEARGRARAGAESASPTPAQPPRREGPAQRLWEGLEQVAQAAGSSARELVTMGSLRFFDAPVVILVSSPGEGTGDVPQFVTTLMLAAHDVGLGTCWLGIPMAHADAIVEAAGIPADEHLAAVVSLGYPDPGAAINSFRSTREDLDSFVRWVGLDD
jgi:nitroreductase